MIRPARSMRKGKEVFRRSVIFFLSFAQFLREGIIKAFTTVLNRAIAGEYPNITSDDVRAMVYLAYLSSTPNFAALNSVLAAALNKDTTGLTYSAFGPLYTPAFLPVLQTICLDQRRCSTNRNVLNSLLIRFLVRSRKQHFRWF
jgi:hypothetical protein